MLEVYQESIKYFYRVGITKCSNVQCYLSVQSFECSFIFFIIIILFFHFVYFYMAVLGHHKHFIQFLSNFVANSLRL